MDRRVYHLNPEQKAQLIESFAEVLADESRLAFACLYGSLVERPNVHDIDLGVYLTRAALVSSSDGFYEIEAHLAERLEEVARSVIGASIAVDVRVVNEAPLPAQYEVLTGEVIYVADRDAFALTVERVVPQFLDLRPLREQALRDVLNT